MDTLAGAFQKRADADFPEHKEALRFLEFLPKNAAKGPELRSLFHALADIFRKPPQAPDIALFSSLNQTLPGLPSGGIQAISESVLRGSSECYAFPKKPGLPQPSSEFYTTFPPFLYVIVGPDKSRTLSDLLGSTFLSSRDPETESRNLNALQHFIYDHETAHALHDLAENQTSEEKEKAEKERLRSLSRNSPFIFEIHETNFRERVADVYAAFRLAAQGGEDIIPSLASYRTLNLAVKKDILHYTSSALRRTADDAASGKLPSSPHAMFERALEIARACPLDPKDVQTEIETFKMPSL